MNKEELDRLLAAGEITQEEYNAKLAELEAKQKEDGKSSQDEVKVFLESDAFKEIIQKQVQSETDKVRTQYSKKNEQLEREVAALKTAQMTEEERKNHELAERERIIAEKEAELNRVRLENHASKVIADEKRNLPSDALSFIMAENETEIENRAVAFQQIVDREVQKRLEAEFAKHNYVPGGTQQSSKTEKNPWSKEYYSLTEQGRLFRENPEKARQMAAQHGYKL